MNENTPVTSRDIARMIDLSLLKPQLREEDIRMGCEEALTYQVASVCCAPSQLHAAGRLLADSQVALSTVIGFPLGYTTTEVKVFEAEQAIAAGCTELDMVMNISNMLSGNYRYVAQDIEAVVAAARPHGVLVKVILENCYLQDEEKRRACRISEEAGADFVKTSTGFGPGGSTFDDIRLMRESVSSRVQVKAAGGIRDLDSVLLIRSLGCSRFGCTATTHIMESARRRFGEAP